MRFVDILDSYIASGFRGTEAEDAVEAYKRRIPGRILQMEFDATHSNKQGIKHENAVYKLGLDLAKNRVFMEYLDDPNQAQPTIAIVIDKAMPAVAINGWQVNRKMQIVYTLKDGQMQKSVNLD